MRQEPPSIPAKKKPPAKNLRWRPLVAVILVASIVGNLLCCCLGFIGGAVLPKGNTLMGTLKDTARVLLAVTDFIGDCLFQFINA
jgi:hypothetical protein